MVYSFGLGFTFTQWVLNCVNVIIERDIGSRHNILTKDYPGVWSTLKNLTSVASSNSESNFEICFIVFLVLFLFFIVFSAVGMWSFEIWIKV